MNLTSRPYPRIRKSFASVLGVILLSSILLPTSPATAASPAPALIPTFSSPVSTAGGFKVNVTNYNPAFVFTPTTTAGSVTVGNRHEHSLALNVIGLAPGASTTLTVTTTRTDYLTGSASVSGTALLAALIPTFSTPVPFASGFTFNVTNYDPAFTFTAKSSLGHVTKGVASGSILPLSVLFTSRTQVAVTVTTTRIGYATGRASVTGTRGSLAALVPTFSTPVSTATGFTVNITNYNPAFTFTPTATAGSVTVGKKHEHSLALKVVGLSPGASATVTVTTARTNYGTGSASVSGTALLAALIPTFSTPVPVTSGFTVNVINYDPAFTFTAKSSQGHVVKGVASGSILPLSVLLTSRAQVTITVTTTRIGYATGRASVTGTRGALAALVPTFNTPVSTAKGFNVDVTNYNPAFTFTPIATGGSVVTGKKHGHTLALSVIGLSPGASATLTVTATRSNYVTGSASVSGSALLAALIPTFSIPVPTANGFTVNVTNYNPAFTFTAKSSVGHVTVGVPSGSILPLTVTGVRSKSIATVTVRTSRTGYAAGRTTVTASAL